MVHNLRGRPAGKPDQTSPIDAADPNDDTWDYEIPLSPEKGMTSPGNSPSTQRWTSYSGSIGEA